MNPTARQLALRDPAAAALFGLTGPDTTFGNESHETSFGAEFSDDYGTEFGDDYGMDDSYAAFAAEFGQAAPAVAAATSALAPRPTPQGLQALWAKNMMDRARSAKRNAILEPNKGSDIKIERYVFTMSQDIALGTAEELDVSDNPSTTIRPQRVTMNAPAPMFATITSIQVSNVLVTVGSGVEDAFNYNALGQGMAMDLPTIEPAQRARVLGEYTGFTPPGFVEGTTVAFTISFRGPSKMVA